MRIVKGYVKTSKIGSNKEFEFGIDDHETDQQIEEMARDAMFECIDWSFKVEPLIHE